MFKPASDGIGYVESYRFEVGELVGIELSIIDKDLDAATLHIEEHQPDGTVEEESFALPAQPYEYSDFHTEPEPFTGPKGEWLFVFTLEDAQGYQSEAYELTVTLKSRSEDDSGSCFINTL